MNKPRGAAPGSNNGGGRKKSERKLVRRQILLYQEHAELTSAEIREAIDLWVKGKNWLKAASNETQSSFVLTTVNTHSEYLVTFEVNENGILTEKVEKIEPK